MEERELIARALAQPPDETTRARWGFTNRTDVVTLATGERVVVQRYRSARAAARRVQIMQGLKRAAAAAWIPIPGVRASDLEAEPPWVVYDLLPGTPVPELGLDTSRFPPLARLMGQLLQRFRTLTYDGPALDDTWADPERLAERARPWARAVGAGEAILDGLPELFAGRAAVLAHGDFVPVNVLTDGTRVTGLLDFEATRLADPLGAG